MALLLDSGECLLDDVDVRINGGVNNELPNGNFDSAIFPWIAQGTHIQTTTNGLGELHVVSRSTVQRKRQCVAATYLSMAASVLKHSLNGQRGATALRDRDFIVAAASLSFDETEQPLALQLTPDHTVDQSVCRVNVLVSCAEVATLTFADRAEQPTCSTMGFARPPARGAGDVARRGSW